ncbi:MAG: 30S ribosomal protein S12 methylthiotransferase RimO [Armatimonadetes bacterium]|nr:30S ribosomal protein S12 methylthiotransferase RimO [Armatimonadota bacterium]
MADPSAGTVALVALGCPKNLVDAEQMLGVLCADGYQLVTDIEQANVIVVNTCGFLQAARDEAVAEIRAAARLKRSGQCDTLVVTGCLAQLTPALIRDKCAEVDLVVGVSEFPHLAELVRQQRAGIQVQTTLVSAPALPYQDSLPRRRATPPWTAYVKIGEGCNCNCTFCLIPTIRGSLRSRSIDSVVAEARALVADGVREVNLIGEDTTGFGSDRGPRELADLLRALGGVDGLDWVRILYAYPTKVDDKLIAAMAETPNVLPYLDMPLQHAADSVLAGMGRGGRRDGYLRLIGKLRAAMPDICLRSTFIVGFPGERRPEFEELATFLDEAALDRVGFFAYSAEAGTPAAALPHQVPAGVARARVAELAERQARVSAARLQALVGRRLTVLVERVAEGELVGRSYRDAPEIDGVVHCVVGEWPIATGEMVDVRIDQADTHDLRGTLVADRGER